MQNSSVHDQVFILGIAFLLNLEVDFLQYNPHVARTKEFLGWKTNDELDGARQIMQWWGRHCHWTFPQIEPIAHYKSQITEMHSHFNECKILQGMNHQHHLCEHMRDRRLIFRLHLGCTPLPSFTSNWSF